MKQITTFLLLVLLWSCESNPITPSEDEVAFNFNNGNGNGNAYEDPEDQKCYSHEHFKKMIASDTKFRDNQEAFERFYQSRSASSRSQLPSIVTIPVVVNVLYNTAAENISAAQIQSQIDILNADYAALNADYNSTPTTFVGSRSGDTKIRFVLQNVVRKSSKKTSWRPDDSMKKGNKGGIDPTNPATTLNIWVCNLAQNLLGYAQFPGGSLATDGVVLDNNATGNTGSATAPFNKGRTATHEVGHWLNLRHIWGDATCGNDMVSDTPLHNAANYGCPAAGHLSSCAGTPVEMTMNYMDYTDDACMYMFSLGQSNRMSATLLPGGPRASFNP